MTEQSKKVALPAYLPRRLEAFRIARDSGHSYLIRDKLLGKTHDFEPWQFFVLEVLPGCEDFAKLASVFEDRFGQKLTPEQLRALFATLADNKLLDDEAARHPLLAPYLKKGYTVNEQGKPEVKSFQGLSPGAVVAPVPAAGAPHAAPPAPAPAAAAAKDEETAPDATLPAGIQDAYGIDSRTVKRLWTLFDPTAALKLLVPPLLWLRYIVYPLPLLLLMSLYIFGRYPVLVLDDIRRLHGTTTLLEHIVFSLLTINLATTVAVAAVAHHFRASVKAIGISIFLGFLPRFVARITNAEQLSRREKLWLHGTPLIMRALLFSLGMLMWYTLRDQSGLLPKVGLGVALLTALDVVFASANPFVKGSLYHLITTWTNEPHLRGKAFKAVVARMRGDRFKEAESNLLVGYGLATLLYSYVLIGLAVFMVAVFLGQARLGGISILLALALGLYLIRGTINRFRLIGEAYERSERFERWRQRALPVAAEGEKPVEPSAKSRFWSYVRGAALIIFIVILFLPYPYEPGGPIKIYPSKQEPLGTDVPGLVSEVYFDGGEKVRKGTVIAKLTVPDIEAALATLEAQVIEQTKVVADLKARPKPEEVTLAERDLDVARKHLDYSREKVPRYEKLYADHSIAFDELDAARRTRDVDAEQVAQKEAALALVKTGVTKEHIEAAEAKLVALKEERDGLKQKVGRTTLTMPFDGAILTLHLKQKVNAYLDRGQPFAVVENTEYVTAEIEVPEPDIAQVRIGSPIRARPNPYSDVEFEGKVTVIDRNITVQPFGNVIKVIAEIKNRDDLLRTGMGGYAKIGGPTLPVWKAFTLAVVRFFNVQVWSWIP
ncbi:HlyD family secretion protein [Aquabacterium sp.]|uniref:HlyD family secretion protein n=1 Tax=Aquabacterium sp. TaxID=1872578 RepID=UPI0037844383